MDSPETSDDAAGARSSEVREVPTSEIVSAPSLMISEPSQANSEANTVTGVPAEPTISPEQPPVLPSSSTAEADVPSIHSDPQISLTFLLVSGQRKTISFPEDYTVSRVKEIVWNTWPSDAEWKDQKPPAPNFLRLLHLGKIWTDDIRLVDMSTIARPPDTPSIVHLSIRPFAPSVDDSMAKKKRNRKSKHVSETGHDGPPVASGEPGVGGGDGGGLCGCCVVC